MKIHEIARLLLRSQKTIAVAESCTGGLISNTLTNVSGSSRYFKLGVIVYDNKAKSTLLSINPQTIKKYGAVSQEVARLMAQKVKSLARTDIGLSTTGIAGPTGGTKQKPVGTVYLAVAYHNKTHVEKQRFTGSRLTIKNKTKNRALFLIKKILSSS